MPEVLRADLWWFSALVLVALPLIIGGGIWVSLRLSRPLAVVAVAARRIAGGDFQARAAQVSTAPAALQHLLADFNHMAERLERHERELQASSAAIAHELRTPLTACNLKQHLSEDTPNSVLHRMDYSNHLTSHGRRAAISIALNELRNRKEWIEVQRVS